MSRERGHGPNGKNPRALQTMGVSGDPWADKEERESLDIFWVINILEAKKGGNLQLPNVTFCSLYSHYNGISLEGKKYPSCTYTMTIPTKTK